MPDSEYEFLGKGWKFPIEFDADRKTVQMLSGEADIQNSLDILLATRLGERIMQPRFGSELDEFVFETAGKSTLTYMEAVLKDAILFNEPRIVVSEISIVQLRDDPYALEITIAYSIPATNNRYNYVYPFYLQEGTNLQR